MPFHIMRTTERYYVKVSIHKESVVRGYPLLYNLTMVVYHHHPENYISSRNTKFT